MLRPCSSLQTSVMPRRPTSAYRRLSVEKGHEQTSAKADRAFGAEMLHLKSASSNAVVMRSRRRRHSLAIAHSVPMRATDICSRRRRRGGDRSHSLRNIAIPVRCGTPSSSSLRNDDLQILAWHDHGTVAGLIHTRDQGVQVILQAVLLGLIESRERLQYRAIVRP